MTLLLLIGGVITITVMLFTDPFGPGSFLAKLHAEIASYFGKRSNSFNTRVDTWNIVLATLSGPDTNVGWIFGIGDFQSRMYLAALHVPIMDGLTIYPAHNAFVQCLCDGGLLRLGIYLIVLGRFFYVAVKRLNAHSKIAVTMILCMATLLIHGGMESTLFLSMDTKGSSILLLFILPLEVESFHAHHPKLADYLAACKADTKKIKYGYEISPSRFAKTAFLYLTPVLVLGVGAGALLSSLGYFGAGADWSFYGLLAAVWLLAPLGYLGIGSAERRKAATFFFTLLILALLGAGIGLMWMNVWATRIAFIAAIVLCPLPFVFRAKTASIYLLTALQTAYLPHFIIGGFLAAAVLLALLVPSDQMSLQIPISLGLGILFVYPCLVALPKGLKLGYPAFEKLRHLDNRILTKSLIREDKIAKKQRRHLDPHFEPHDKRVYLTHPW